MTSRGNLKQPTTLTRNDVRRGMKVIKKLHVMRIKGRRMSQMISLYKVNHLP
ncbi:MAG: hypothetical protein PV344_04035 [Anaplasma sp.]|nr:hypothetical protein [Anaplasma sp.]